MQCAIQCIPIINGASLHLNNVITPISMIVNTTTLSHPKHVNLLTTCCVVKPPCSINDLNINWVRLLIMLPLNTFSRSSNNGTLLKPGNNVCMHISPRLIIDSGYFIIINNDVLNFLDNNFCGLHDNAMNYLYHLPTCGITLMLAKHAFHLQEIK